MNKNYSWNINNEINIERNHRSDILLAYVRNGRTRISERPTVTFWLYALLENKSKLIIKWSMLFKCCGDTCMWVLLLWLWTSCPQHQLRRSCPVFHCWWYSHFYLHYFIERQIHNVLVSYWCWIGWMWIFLLSFKCNVISRWGYHGAHSTGFLAAYYYFGFRSRCQRWWVPTSSSKYYTFLSSIIPTYIYYNYSYINNSKLWLQILGAL